MLELDKKEIPRGAKSKANTGILRSAQDDDEKTSNEDEKQAMATVRQGMPTLWTEAKGTSVFLPRVDPKC
jgi:hypothetical protein